MGNLREAEVSQGVGAREQGGRVEAWKARRELRRENER